MPGNPKTAVCSQNPEGEGLAGLDRHPPEGEERSGVGERLAHQILGTDRDPPDGEEDVGAPRPAKRAPEAPGPVAGGLEEERLSPRFPDGGGKGPAVRLPDGADRERPSRRDELIAGGEDGHPGPPRDLEGPLAQGRGEPERGWVEQGARPEGDLAAGEVGPLEPQVLAGPYRTSEDRERSAAADLLLHLHGVGALWEGGPGEDAAAASLLESEQGGPAGEDLEGHLEPRPGSPRRPGRAARSRRWWQR